MPAKLGVDQLRCEREPGAASLGPSSPTSQQPRLRSGPSLAPRLPEAVAMLGLALCLAGPRPGLAWDLGPTPLAWLGHRGAVAVTGGHCPCLPCRPHEAALAQGCEENSPYFPYYPVFL